METYQIFVVQMGNTKITEELELQAPEYLETPNNKKEKSWGGLDDKEAPKDSLSPSDKREKSKYDSLAQSSEKKNN